jgi:predicted nuclease of predicted toxin-antitoxin system
LDKIFALKTLELQAGYWYRSGELRANTLREGHKAKLADVLIAQSCIDHDVPLITNDADFRHFSARDSSSRSGRAFLHPGHQPVEQADDDGEADQPHRL